MEYYIEESYYSADFYYEDFLVKDVKIYHFQITDESGDSFGFLNYFNQPFVFQL